MTDEGQLLQQYTRERSESAFGEVQELFQPKTNATKSRNEMLASLTKRYSERMSQVTQWLETNPSEKIPELRYVTRRKWLDSIYNLNLDTEDGCRRAVSRARSDAERGILYRLQKTLRPFVRDNNGQFPTDLSQLKPYFDSPIDDAILQRYVILPASNLVQNMQVGEDWLITQKAPVNEAYDQRVFVGSESIRLGSGTNQWFLVH